MQEPTHETIKAFEEVLNRKPVPEQFGWHNQQGFDDLESGWMHEGGEEAYFEALRIWEETNNTKEDAGT